MHAQHCCLWLKLQPPFSWAENSPPQVPLPREEGKEGRGGCVCSLESAHACIPEHARQDALVPVARPLGATVGTSRLLGWRWAWMESRGDVKHSTGDEETLNTSKQGWTQQRDVHGIFLHAMHSSSNLVSRLRVLLLLYIYI